MPGTYGESVFLNCPFDGAYRRIMEAVVFAVHDFGFVARSTLELDDASQPRIQKIYGIILASRFGIHDLSRTELDPHLKLPRFNMPLELGIFLGIKHAGSGCQQEKRCLILDVEPYRYQAFCSDIAGQDAAIRPRRSRGPTLRPRTREDVYAAPGSDRTGASRRARSHQLAFAIGREREGSLDVLTLQAHRETPDESIPWETLRRELLHGSS